MKQLFLFTFLLPFFTTAQKLSSIAEKTNGMKKYEGFFNFYWDADKGKIWLEINKLDTEVLYQTSLPAGLGSNDIGLDRGLTGSTRIIKFEKIGRKILMVQPNFAYRAITSDVNEKRAVEESFAQSVIWGFVAEAQTNNSVLIDASTFLLHDAMNVAETLKKNKQGNYSLDTSRCAMYMQRTKNFPLNTELEATITLVSTDGSAGNYAVSYTHLTLPT